MDTIKLFRDSKGELQIPPRTSIPDYLVATVGTFDGIHLGHQFLFSELKKKAKEIGKLTAVVTFDKLPISVIRPNSPYELLDEEKEREDQLQRLGIDFLFILPFDLALSNLSTQKFLEQILFKLLHIQFLVSGYDNRFGKRIPGKIESSVEDICENIGISFYRSPVAYDHNGREYSSSLIRTLLKEGQIEEANSLLGYLYSLRGIVIGGSQIGRKIGFPTANLSPINAQKILPQNGVYAAYAKIENENILLPGMLYIGERPTITNKKEKRIEINIFDFKGNLYGKELTLLFSQFIREDIRFESLEELIDQLHQDNKVIRKILLK